MHNSQGLQELTEYKKRIEQNDAENEGFKKKTAELDPGDQFLGEEVRTAQENLRLSADQISNSTANSMITRTESASTTRSLRPTVEDSEAHGRELLDGRRSQDCARKPQAVRQHF